MTRLERTREALAVWEPADGEGEELAVPALVEVERAEAVIQAAREAAYPQTPDGPAAPFMWKPANDALLAALDAVTGGHQ